MHADSADSAGWTGQHQWETAEAHMIARDRFSGPWTGLAGRTSVRLNARVLAGSGSGRRAPAWGCPPARGRADRSWRTGPGSPWPCAGGARCAPQCAGPCRDRRSTICRRYRTMCFVSCLFVDFGDRRPGAARGSGTSSVLENVPGEPKGLGHQLLLLLLLRLVEGGELQFLVVGRRQGNIDLVVAARDTCPTCRRHCPEP